MRSPLFLFLLALASPAAAQRLDYEPVSDDSLAEPALLAYQPVDVPDPAAEATAPPAKRGKWLQWALLDRFEYAAQGKRDGYAWDFSALIGGDRHRLWLGTSGDGPALSGPDYVELNALYSYHVGGAWDLNGGLRFDAQPRPTRSYAVLGAQYDDGDAWLGAFGYLSHKGETSARIAGYYNQPLAGPLILQPSAELEHYGEDVAELGLGRGVGYAEAGLRLRYEIREAFAPYVGLSWSRDLGRTARLTREEGEDPETKSVVMGVRSAF
ncbi:MAG TPA: copper resistance protein B [Allosphingosinicella sp.]|nr:copper resistance protein B [Allosphingosinicella sp.]